MNLTEYQKAARYTAHYPESARVIYPALGLGGEAGEIAEKVSEGTGTRREIADECGDVLWYAATLASDLEIPLGTLPYKLYIGFAKDIEEASLRLCAATGRTIEHVKKALRKGVPYDRSLIASELGIVLNRIEAVADKAGYSLEQIAVANIAKLKDRDARNVLHGEGDRR